MANLKLQWRKIYCAVLAACWAVASCAQTQPAASLLHSEEPGVKWQLPSGLKFPVQIKTDYSKTFRGGLSTRGSIARTLLDAGVAVNVRRLFGHGRGLLFANMQGLRGGNATAETGVFQAITNIDAEPDWHLYEAWYEAGWNTANIRLKVGQVDANKEFAYVENGAEFLNASMGFSPAILGLPTYPAPRPSVNLFLNPLRPLQARVSVYDTQGRGSMSLAELAGRWRMGDNDYAGRLGVGGWKATGITERFDGQRQSGTQGLYVVLDQDLWKSDRADSDAARSVGMYLQYAHGDEAVSPVAGHWGGGVRATGMIAARPRDIIGLGITRASFTRRPEASFSAPAELAIEALYKVSVSEWLSFTVDVQHLRHPNADAGLHSALTSTLRATIDLNKYLAPEDEQ